MPMETTFLKSNYKVQKRSGPSKRYQPPTETKTDKHNDKHNDKNNVPVKTEDYISRYV